MKNIALILLVFTLGFTSSCKKAKLSKGIDNTAWQISQVLLNEEDITAEVLKNEIVYRKLNYASSGGEIVFSEPTRESVDQEEVGEWELEKIVPTVGKSYYLIKNTLIYSQKRAGVFNLHQYGSEVMISGSNQLTQTVEEYTIIYEKVN